MTVKGAVGTETEQGVRQEGPAEVRASAPVGRDSSWSVVIRGAGVRKSRPGTENDAQPERAILAREITITRRILHPSFGAASSHTHPRFNHKIVAVTVQRSGTV